MRTIIFDYDGAFVSPYEVEIFKKELRNDWITLKICDTFALDIIRTEIKNKKLDYKDLEFIFIDDDTEEEIVCLFDETGRWYNPKETDCIKKYWPENKYMAARTNILIDLI